MMGKRLALISDDQRLALAVQAHKRFGSVNPQDLRALRD